MEFITKNTSSTYLKP